MKSCHWALWFVKSYLISFANIAVFVLRMFGEELKILCVRVTTERFRTVIGVLVVRLIIIITVSSFTEPNSKKFNP